MADDYQLAERPMEPIHNRLPRDFRVRITQWIIGFFNGIDRERVNRFASLVIIASGSLIRVGVKRRPQREQVYYRIVCTILTSVMHRK